MNERFIKYEQTQEKQKSSTTQSFKEESVNFPKIHTFAPIIRSG